MHAMHELEGRHFDELAAFLAVVEHGSFVRAGDALDRDASIVSKRVTALEGRLGVRLVERTTRTLHVTEAGGRLAARLRLATRALSEAEQEASAAAGAALGLVRLALPGTFGRMWIAPLLPDFLRAHPRVQLEVTYAERFVDLVAEGYDAAVRVGPMPPSSLVVRRLAPNRRMLCASPAYLAARGAIRSPAQLADHACLGFSRLASHPEWRLTRGGRVESVRVSGPLVSDDAETLVGAATAGLGILVATDWLVGRALHTGALVRVLPRWSLDDPGAIHLVRPSTKLLAGKTKAFVDWLVARFVRPPWLA